jgi:hypothetical protein
MYSRIFIGLSKENKMKVSQQTVWADDNGTQLIMLDPSADEKIQIRIYPDWVDVATAKNLISALKEVLETLEPNQRYSKAVEDLAGG